MAWIGQIQSTNPWHLLACLLGAYALGCFGTGYYLVRARTGRDLREIGSGSTGARNVGRVLGRSGLGLTLLGDFTKGALAVWVAQRWGGTPFTSGVALLAVTVGHIWPVQLGLRGGKGVATSLGGLLVFDWHSALVYFVVFLFLFGLLRRMILPGLLAYLALPFAVWWFLPDPISPLLVAGLVGVVWNAHRENLVTEFLVLSSPRRAMAHPNPPGS